MIDTLTASLVVWTCALAFVAELLIAFVRRSIPHACFAMALAVVFVIYALAIAGAYEPVQLRTPLRVAMAGLMFNLFLMHRHEARDGLSVIRHRVLLWKRRRRS